MRKIGILVSALIVSLNCHADLKSAIHNTTTATQNNTGGTSLSMIYGGEDVSRHEIAAAKDPYQVGQSGAVG